MNNPTIKDIAREAGVSIASVSRVLNNQGYASPNMRKKVLKKAKELNYYTNDIAKSLKTNKTYTIGVLIPDIANSFFMNISKGLEDAIADTKYNLIFTSGMENVNKEEELLHLLIKKRVDGIVLATAGLHTELINNILTSNTPVVLVDRKIKGLESRTDWVIENNIEGSYQLTKKLIEEGHKKIGVISGLLRVSTGVERYQGYEKAMNEHGLEIDSSYIFQGDYSEKAGKDSVSFFLKLTPPPTALLSLNNTMTVGAIKELMKNNINGKKNTIASYGEVEFQNYLNNIKLYSVKQNPYKMGKIVGERMLSHLSTSESDNEKSKITFLEPEYNFDLKET